MTTLKVLWLGIKDGYEQHLELTSGMTYPGRWLNEVYDTGVNIGQMMGKWFKFR